MGCGFKRVWMSSIAGRAFTMKRELPDRYAKYLPGQQHGTELPK